MDYYNGIYRHKTSRPFQLPVWRKFIVMAVGAFVPDVGSVVSLPKIRSQRVRTQPQQARKIALNVPRQVSIPWIDVIRERTERYAKLHSREVFDVREVYRAREVYGTTPVAPSVSSHIYRHPPVSYELFRGFKRARRLKLPFIETVAAAAADIGWLVSYMIKRGYSHNLRR
ncbi:MAG: hypothetical protein ACWGQW_06240 [bacterium]